MTLSELKAAIERKDDKSVSVSSRYAACARVADAFTSREPISREKLEAMGVHEDVEAGQFVFKVGIGEVGVESWHDPRCTYRQDGHTRELDPQPRTIGDLWRLLERLSRD